MTANLPATPPADEALRNNIVAYLITSMPGMSEQYRRYAEEAADEIMHRFKSRAEQEKAAAVLEGQIELLDQMLEAQDQELDVDGKPITEPYAIFRDDGERFWIADVKEGLEHELAELRDGGGTA